MDWSAPALITPPSKPMFAVLCGPPKVGKTLLAATFPKVLWMPWENPGPVIAGRKDIIFPGGILEKFEDGMSYLKWAWSTEMEYETLVVDTCTNADQAWRGQIIASDPKKPQSIADAIGGWGKGFQAISEMHRKFVGALLALRDKRQCNIVVVAHSDIGKVSPPDGETYTRYELALHEDSFKHYTSHADLIGFMKQKLLVREGEDGKQKVASTQDRILTCYESAAHISGNRYGITEDIKVPIGVNVLEQYLRADRASVKRELKEGETF